MRKLFAGFFAVCVLLLASTACGQDEGFLEIFAGDPYTGYVRVVAKGESLPGGARRDRGRGSAQFEKLDNGQARLTVFGIIKNDAGDAGFSMEGPYDRSSWRARAGDVSLSIDAGQVTGGGVTGNQRFTFSGVLTATRFDLQVDLEPLPRAGQDPPAVTIFTFDYRLRREGADAADDDGDCREIRYEMRPVANIGDGSMSMLNVPVCLD